MWKKLSAVGALSALTLVWVLSAQSPAQKAIEDSLKAMGVSDVKTLTLSGEGGDGFVGQHLVPNAPKWRWYSNKDFVRGYDFDNKGYRTKRTRGEGNVPPGGGAGTTTPAPTQNQDQVTMATAFAVQVEMAMTPIGFLKAAQTNTTTLSTRTDHGKKYTVLSYPIDAGTYKTTVNGFIDEKNLVQKVEVLINETNYLGDIIWDAQFDGWKDFGGVKFPAHIAQHQWKPLYFELNVSDVKVNQPVDLTQQGKGGPGGPGGGKGGAPGGGAAKGKGDANAKGKGAAKGGPEPLAGSAPTGVPVEDLGGGFWLVKGGYGSIIADFKDGVMVIEASQNDARSAQVADAIKRLIPNKPVKYIINTHFHFDHTGGLRYFAKDGYTLVTHKANKGLYEETLKIPHTLVPDELQKAGNKPKVKVEYVDEKKVFDDGAHRVELYHLQGSTHNTGMLLVYLPKQKLIQESDEFNVNAQAPTAPLPMPNGYQVNLQAQVEKLHLDVERYVPTHLPNDDRKVTAQELRYMAGKQ
jgi:glyoxylase-like metal-dependent hydrolase (beta-lactamase superfamily II)